jgi:hypothetical protein
MSDYFGYTRQTQANQIISADNAVIDIGNGRLGLVQSFQGGYSHQVEPRFEMGSSTLFWVNGKPSGQFQVSKLVGREGILSEFRGGASGGSDACGGLRQIAVSLDKASCDVQVGSGVNFNGAKLQSVKVSGSAGAFEIAESATFVDAELT